jgi:ABC-2 type transport system ATP-binding protein
MVAAEYALVVDGASKAFRADSPLPRLRLLRGRASQPPKRVLAVDNVSLRMQRGEIYGILGTNGSGKSTLIRLVSTLLLPDSGTVRMFGRDVVRQEQEVKRLINRVSVEASFFKKLSSMENLLYFVQALDDSALPADNELRAALTAYMEWAAQDVMSYAPADAVVPAGHRVPRWSWNGLQDGAGG